VASQGFSNELYKFLKQLAKNNDKEWFNANKQRYLDHIVAPGKAYIEAIDEQLPQVSDHITASTKTNGGSMFRIYRDARFSKDKRPYKENIGFHFRHAAGRDAHAPGFYVHIEPKQVFIGGGIWNPPTPVLNKIREFIDDNPNAWKKIKADKKIIKRFGEIQGDRLKRPPRGFAADHPLIDDLKLKSFFLMHEIEPEKALKPAFVKTTIDTFKDASPLMSYICMAIDQPF